MGILYFLYILHHYDIAPSISIPLVHIILHPSLE
jgi:hypothetical protein